MDLEASIERAAGEIARATALLITAGAGMGVDSGLPDFRGTHGFWRAYPPYAKLGLRFEDLANPWWFERDPALAWGFYGHRLELYRRTRPHAGFAILLRWARAMRDRFFVYTSNVDGQFQRAGFPDDRITECHGAIDHLQCTASCGADLFAADPFTIEIDPEALRATGPLPRCPRCGALARPAILMFGDADWDSTRTYEQQQRQRLWMQELGGRAPRLVVVECGAGTAIPTVRWTSERVAAELGGLLVRINVREPEVPDGAVGLPRGALEALTAIDRRVAELRTQ